MLRHQKQYLDLTYIWYSPPPFRYSNFFPYSSLPESVSS